MKSSLVQYAKRIVSDHFVAETFPGQARIMTTADYKVVIERLKEKATKALGDPGFTCLEALKLVAEQDILKCDLWLELYGAIHGGDEWLAAKDDLESEVDEQPPTRAAALDKAKAALRPEKHTDGCPGGPVATSQSHQSCASWCRLYKKDR